MTALLISTFIRLSVGIKKILLTGSAHPVNLFLNHIKGELCELVISKLPASQPSSGLPLVNILLGNHLFAVNPCDKWVCSLYINIHPNGSPLYFSLSRVNSNLWLKQFSFQNNRSGSSLSTFDFPLHHELEFKIFPSSDLKCLSKLIFKRFMMSPAFQSALLNNVSSVPVFKELLLELYIE